MVKPSQKQIAPASPLEEYTGFAFHIIGFALVGVLIMAIFGDSFRDNFIMDVLVVSYPVVGLMILIVRFTLSRVNPDKHFRTYALYWRGFYFTSLMLVAGIFIVGVIMYWWPW